METITIEKREYNELREKSFRLNVIFKAIFNGARLNYNNTELRFEDECLVEVIKCLYPEYYQNELTRFTEALKENEHL